MTRSGSRVAALFFVAVGELLVATDASAVVLDRPPEILQARQVGTKIRLLWGPGGNADGTLNNTVVSYTLERRIGGGGWTTIFTDDPAGSDPPRSVTYVDDLSASMSWATFPTLRYRVTAKTQDQVATTSGEFQIAFGALATPLWLSEAQDGKARVAWIPSTTPLPGLPVLVGYIPQKNGSNGWQDLTQAPNPNLFSYIDPNTTTGSSTYRVRAVYRNNAGTSTGSRISTSQEITLQAMCEGQAVNPSLPPLHVIEVGDLDQNGHYEGNDIALALLQCGDEEYEVLGDGIGNDDGVCTQVESQLSGCVQGGCILRALPVTYENVAIMITDDAHDCDSRNDQPTNQWDGDISHPENCLQLDLPAGLVVEGQGRETVFRSPVWDADTEPLQYLPASVLDIHEESFPVTLRNLVFDGRKQEQDWPGNYTQQTAWHHFGFRMYFDGGVEKIGTQTACKYEDCVETPDGNNDADGRCEVGEECVESTAPNHLGNNNGICESDEFPDAVTCESSIHADNGCIHNVEFRNFFGTGVRLMHASHWIIEDSEIHDMGCVNRGFGFDCPRMYEAPDAVAGFEGLKSDGYGIDIGPYASDFKVRRNEFYRTSKYALDFKNGTALSCDGLVLDSETSNNYFHDLGFVGIFNIGSVGARIHDNLIYGTTVFKEPAGRNGDYDTFGMSLGGFCSWDNQFYNNQFQNMAGIAIAWDGDTQRKECSGTCTPVTPLGDNTIRDTTIYGSCVEKQGAPGQTNPYEYGAIHLGHSAGGTLLLTNNTLAGNLCGFVATAHGQNPGIQPLDARISEGSYQTGPNLRQISESSLFCGAVHAHGTSRKIVVENDTQIINDTATPEEAFPKACVGYGAKVVIDDNGTDPFQDGPFSSSSISGGDGTIVECSGPPPNPPSSDPDCL